MEINKKQIKKNKSKELEISLEPGISLGPVPSIIEIKPVENTKQDLIDFIDSMKYKTRATPEDIKKMYAIYKKYTGRIESNLTCDACVIKIFTILKKLI